MSTARFRIKPLALMVASLCAATAVSAQEAAAVDSTAVAENHVTWGTQVSSNSMLSEDIAMKQADHLSDLLRGEAGVDVGGSHSMNQGINIRGVSELDLEITIDGVDQSNNVFHHAGNLLVNPDILKAVDVQVGKNSVINSGIGGGVAFETKDGRDLLKADQQFGARVSGGYATNDYHKYSATGYGQLTDTLDFLAYYSAVDRDNFEDGNGDERVGQEGKTENYMAKLGWDTNASNRFELSYDYYKDKGDYTIKSNMGPGWGGHEGAIDPIEYTRETIALNHELAVGMTDVRTSVYYNEMNYKRADENASDPAKEGYVSEGNTRVYGIKSLAETGFELGSTFHEARYGFLVDRQESKRVEEGRTLGNSKEDADSFALYFEDEIELTDGLYVTPGIRYDHYKVDMAASDKTFDDTTFGLAAKYELTEQWTLRAAATELFKGPALTGSYLTSGSEMNPDLKAETGINYEAGVAFQDQNIAGLETLAVSFNVFQTEVDDYIDDTMTGKQSLYSNLGDYEITGFESALTLTQGNLSGRLTYSQSDSEFTRVEADSGLIKGQGLEDEVGDSVSFNLGYDMEKLGLNLSWTSLVTFDEDVNDADNTKKDGYKVHDINVQWVPATMPDLILTAGIENIFDETYASHASHDFGFTDLEPGRNYKITVAYVF